MKSTPQRKPHLPLPLLLFLLPHLTLTLTSPYDIPSSSKSPLDSFSLDDFASNKRLIDVGAKVVDDLDERKLAPRTIRDDQVIRKKKGKVELVNEGDSFLKDDDLQKSIWDEESINMNDIELSKGGQTEQKQVQGLIKDVKVLNSQISQVIGKSAGVQRAAVKGTGLTDSAVSTETHKSTELESGLTKSVTTNAPTVNENKALTTSGLLHSTDNTPNQDKRNLNMFSNYIIRRRYTLNPELNFSKDELTAMPKKPKQELVVGILTLPISHILRNKIRAAIKEKVPASEYPSYAHLLNDMTFYPSSYAKWLEHNGIKTVPILINQDITRIYDLIDHLDGLLLTGGATPLFLKNNIIQVDSSGVGSSTKIKHPSDYLNIVGQIIKYAKKKNLDKPFPVWGTCLGFEAIILDESRLGVTLSFVHNNNKNLTNEIEGGANGYRMTSFLNPEDLNTLEKMGSSFFNHDYAFTAHNFLRNHWLNNQYDLVGTTKAGSTTIVSMIEHKTLPIYGVQFHPEKIIYEFNKGLVAKDLESKKLSNKLSLFFVSGKFLDIISLCLLLLVSLGFLYRIFLVALFLHCFGHFGFIQ